MKKVLFLASILLLSGCSVQYELNVSKDIIKENITIMAEDSNDNSVIEYVNYPVQAIFESNMFSEDHNKMPNVEYYNITKNLQSPLYQANLTYNFSWKDYNNSYLVNQNIEDFYFGINELGIMFSAKIKEEAFDTYNGINNLDVIINLTKDFEIVDANADNINNNTLKWTVNKENCNTKNIYLVINETSENSTNDIDNNNNNNNNNNNENNSNEKPQESENNKDRIEIETNKEETIITKEDDEKISIGYAVAISLIFVFSLIIIIVISKMLRRN